MVAISTYLAGHIGAWLRGTNFPSPPAGLYVALSTADPGDNGGALAQVGARILFTPTTVSVSEGSGAVISNASSLTSGPLSGSIATHFAIFDSAVGGNMLFKAPLSVGQFNATAVSFTAAIGTLRLQLAGLISSYFATALLNWTRGDAMPAAAPSVYVAYSRANPLRSGGGLLEPNAGDGYARELISFSAPVVTPGAGITLYNDSDILFGPAVNNSWPAITHLAFFDALTSGNMLLSGAVTSPFIVPVGTGYGFAAAAFSLNIR